MAGSSCGECSTTVEALIVLRSVSAHSAASGLSTVHMLHARSSGNALTLPALMHVHANLAAVAASGITAPGEVTSVDATAGTIAASGGAASAAIGELCCCALLVMI